MAGLMSVVFKRATYWCSRFRSSTCTSRRIDLSWRRGFGLVRLRRPWVVDREDVAYIGARARAPIMETVQIGLDRFTSLDFGTWHSEEILDPLRDLGYPVEAQKRPYTSPKRKA